MIEFTFQNIVSILSLFLALASLLISIWFNYEGKRWEHGLAYKIEYIKDNFPKISSHMNASLNRNNQFFNGDYPSMADYGDVDRIIDNQEMDLIRSIDPKIADSMKIVYEKLNPKILEMNILYGKLKDMIIKDWSGILRQKEHRGISEEALARDIFEKSKKEIFTEQYEKVDSAFDDIMKANIPEYSKNPYPDFTKDEFKTQAKKRLEERYSNLLEEIKKLNEDQIIKIILPKLEEKITKPF